MTSLRTTAGGCLLLTLFLSGCARPSYQTHLAPPSGSAAVAARVVRVSAEKSEAAEPAVAGARDGTIYAAWVEHRGKEADVWLAHFDAEAKPLGQPVRVNPNAGEATSWRGDPPTVAVSAEGTVYVGWTARDEAAPHATTLYLSASRDGGHSFASPSKVNDDRKHCDHGLHSLAVGDGGHVYMAWLDDRNVKQPEPSEGGGAHMHAEPNRELFFASSVDGGRTFSPRRALAAAGGRGTPVLLRDAGGFKAVWEGSEGTTPVALTVGFKDEDSAPEPSTLAGTGALPAAAEAGGQLFVAYVEGGEGERAVWLARSAAP